MLGEEEANAWGGETRSFEEAEMGAGEGKRGTAGCEAVDSPWGVGEVCTGGVKNFSPFVSV